MFAMVILTQSKLYGISKGINMEGLTEGRNCHYILSEDDDVLPSAVGQHRAALVVRVWNKDLAYASLTVFLDVNDTEDNELLLFAGSRYFNDTDKPNGTFHWIEKA